MENYSLRIQSTDIAKLKSHAEMTFPEECCGVLIGKQQDGIFIVDETRPMRNINESKNTRFNIDPFDLIKLEDELDAESRLMIGIYHSHPNHPPKPSETDLKFAWPSLNYIIVSVVDGKMGQITSWTLSETENKKQFVEVVVNVEQKYLQ